MAFPVGGMTIKSTPSPRRLKRAFDRRGAVSVGFVTGLY